MFRVVGIESEHQEGEACTEQEGAEPVD